MSGLLSVHIGISKAASTSVQKLARSREDSLHEAGLVTETRLLEAAGLTRADVLGIGGPAAVARSWAHLEELLREPTVRGGFFSDEMLCQWAAEPLERLAGLARDAGLRLVLLAVVREQAGWLVSYHAHRAACLLEPRDFHAFAGPVLEGAPAPGGVDVEYARLFARWLDRDDLDFVAIPYTDRRDARPLPVRLLEAAGILETVGAGLAEDAPRARIVPGPRTVEALRRLSRRVEDGRTVDREPLGRRLIAEAEALGWNATRYDPLSPEDRERIAAQFADGNEGFALAAWGRPWDAVHAAPEPHPYAPNAIREGADPAVDREIDAFVEDACRRHAAELGTG